jgi:hypothetical protein
VNPKLKLSGTKVEMSYPEDPIEQYLRYGSMYDEGLANSKSQ